MSNPQASICRQRIDKPDQKEKIQKPNELLQDIINKLFLFLQIVKYIC